MRVILSELQEGSAIHVVRQSLWQSTEIKFKLSVHYQTIFVAVIMQIFLKWDLKKGFSSNY